MDKQKSAQDILKEIELDNKNRKNFEKKPFRVKITKKEMDALMKKEKIENKELAKKIREERRIFEKKKENKKKNNFYNKNKMKIKTKSIKLKKRVFNLFDSDDRFLFTKFFYSVLFNGLFINFGIYCIYVSRFGTRFTWWSFLGFGIALWYIENNLVNFIKRIKKRGIN